MGSSSPPLLPHGRGRRGGGSIRRARHDHRPRESWIPPGPSSAEGCVCARVCESAQTGCHTHTVSPIPPSDSYSSSRSEERTHDDLLVQQKQRPLCISRPWATRHGDQGVCCGGKVGLGVQRAVAPWPLSRRGHFGSDQSAPSGGRARRHTGVVYICIFLLPFDLALKGESPPLSSLIPRAVFCFIHDC